MESEKQSVLILAGEKSGEEHAKSFFPKLREEFPNWSFWGVGGDYLRSFKVETVYDLSEFSTFGITEAIVKIGFYLKARKRLLEEVKKRKTKIAILIDFQSFNLSLAKKLHKQGVKVLYYVAPQAWAWKAYRANVIGECTDTLFCILPFEKKWFEDRGVKNVHAIKHPLLRITPKVENNGDRKELVFLPGSRESEARSLFPIFEKIIKHFSNQKRFSFSIVKTDSIPEEIYEYYDHLFDQSYHSSKLNDALERSYLAIAASGTVTLSTALMKVPTLVCYRVGILNETIARSIVKYKGFVSLVNLIEGKEIFPEYLQDECNAPQLIRKMEKLFQKEAYEEVVQQLNDLRSKMEGALDSAAPYMIERMKDAK